MTSYNGNGNGNGGAHGSGSRRRSPRVLHVGKFYPPQMGGMETHLQALCNGLREHVDVRVLVSSGDNTHAVERVDGVRVTRLATALTFARAPICPAMASRIRDANADIVHLHLPNPAAVLAYLASGTRSRLVVSYHSDVVRQRVLGAAFRPFLDSALRRADAILAATPNHIDTSSVLMQHRARCRVVPYGISLNQFEADSGQVEVIRNRYGRRIILTVGRLVYYKGLDSLIRAMDSIDGHLLLVGEGPMREELQREAQLHGVADRITFLGGVTDIAPYYHAADVFVLPSVARSEAFGIVQLEAMACGKPVVNTSIRSGVPYVSRNGETGVTVPPRNPSSLAKAINQLLDDETLRAEYGRAARRRVEEEFSQERMVASTLGIYQEILGRAKTTLGRSRSARPVARAEAEVG